MTLSERGNFALDISWKKYYGIFVARNGNVVPLPMVLRTSPQGIAPLKG